MSEREPGPSGSRGRTGSRGRGLECVGGIDRAQRIDQSGTEDVVAARGAEVGHARVERLLHLVGRQARCGGLDQCGDARDVRGGHRGAAHPDEGAVEVRGRDVHARRRDVDVGAVVGEGGLLHRGVDRGHRDHPGIGARVVQDGVVVVAGGRDDGHALRPGVGDGRGLDGGGPGPAQRHVDDVGALVGRPDDAVGDPRGVAGAVVAQHLDRQDLGAVGHALDPRPGVGGHRAGHVRAVPVVVGRVQGGTAVGEVVAGQQGARELRVGATPVSRTATTTSDSGLSTAACAASERIMVLPYWAYAPPSACTGTDTSAALTDGCDSSRATAAAASLCESASRLTISGPLGVETNAASGTPSPLVVAARVAPRRPRACAQDGRQAGDLGGGLLGQGRADDETATTSPAAQAATRHVEEVTGTGSAAAPRRCIP